MRERRGFGQISIQHADAPRFDAAQHCEEALGVHGFGHTIIDRLPDQGVVGDLAFANDVLEARLLVGEGAGEQVVGADPHQVAGHLLAGLKPGGGERARRVVAPANLEHRRVEQRLDQDRLGGSALQELADARQIEAVRGPERQDDGVFRSGGL